MADFVAVIRRAVDGLTDNTPEMRTRVYDKARGAVIRQLENMNPRPSEAMFKRQLDKLDAAIQQVEEENSEAVFEAPAPEVQPEQAAQQEEAAEQEQVPVRQEEPAELAAEAAHTEAAEQPEQNIAPQVVSAAPAVEEHEEPAQYASPEQGSYPEHAPQDMQQADEAEATRHEAVGDHWQPADDGAHGTVTEPEGEVPNAETQAAEYHAEAAHHEVEGEASSHDGEPVQQDFAEAEPVEAAQDAPATHGDDDRLPDVAEAGATEEHDDPLLTHFEPVREPAIRHAANRVMEEPVVQAESEFPGGETSYSPSEQDLDRPAYAEPEHEAAAPPAWDVEIDREPEAAFEAPSHSPQMPRAALTETDVATRFDDFVKSEFSTPAVKPPPSRRPPDNEFSWDAPFDDLPDLPRPAAFQDALEGRQEELARSDDDGKDQPQDARAELETLIGYASPADGDAAVRPEGKSPSMTRRERKSFKLHKKNRQRFNPLPIAFGVAGALLVAGAAYGVYAYRDDVSTLVAGYMQPDEQPATSETRAVEEAADEPAEQPTEAVAAQVDDAAAPETTAAEPKAEEQPTEVASLDPNIVASKFTQRLLADGTEAETDAAKIPVDQSLSEGKTVTGQTEVASSDPGVKPADTTAQSPGLTVTQKMFLYEERLGGSPVAVPGTVSWQLKPDTTNTGGKEQSMVEATVEVPERKLKAVISFKRNSDVSLPASHIIEVVFDLPADFAEGNVESVQRIAFKQTEQDRGNSLIAVPAKITDDFHMIALNDDTDARKVNVDLMKTRSWIDIPVIYRNNRRALLTFEKGSTGTEAFDKALAQWAALGAQVSSD